MAFTPIPKGTQDWDTPLNAALSDIDTRVSQNTGDIAQASADAGDALNQVAALSSTVGELGGDVVDLENAVSVVQSDVISLQTRTEGQTYYYLVAASNAPAEVKAKADWVATGVGDEAAIQSAIDAAQAVGGGIVQLSSGTFLTSAPITLHPCVTLRGVHGNQIFNADQLEPLSYIAPQSGFAGGAVIVMLGQTAGGYADKSAEQQIQDLTIVGSNSAIDVHGIQASDYIHGVKLINVCINRVTGKGIYTFTENGAQPFSWTMNKVVVDNSGGVGYHLINHTDLTAIDTIAIGCQADGYVLSNMPNSRMIGCRSEWNFGHGYKIEGNWGDGQGSGGMQMTSCSTDRNMLNGFDITSTGNGPILLTGVTTRRDGANWNSGGGGYAGIFCAGAETPIVISGWANYPGQNDDGTGAPSPENGLVVNNNESIQLGTSYVHAVTTSISDPGNNVVFTKGVGVVLATGPSDAPVKSVPIVDMEWQPGDSGFKAWTQDPLNATGGASSTTGTVYFSKVAVRNTTTVTNLSIVVTTIGAGLTAGQSLLGLYNAAGVKLGETADQSANWVTVGMKSSALAAPVVIQPGYYWVAMMSNGTTPAQFLRGNSQSSSALNTGNLRHVNTTGNTALPATFTPGSANTDNNGRWAALS